MISFGISHKGNIRNENQDDYMNIDTPIGELENIYVVADGMGGHLGGAKASRMAVETIVSTIPEVSGNPLDIIKAIVEKANEVIYKTSVEDSSLFGMGTTGEVVTVKNDKVYFGHVGDSRIYALTGDKMIQLSHDHSYVQELVDAGAITEEEAYTHPNKNRITRAVGVDTELEIDIEELDIPGDWNYLLLCSDGLTNMIKDIDILDLINKSTGIEEACIELLQTSLDNGGLDNITLVLVDLKGGLNND